MNKPATLHPDHLLDQARRGALSPEAWRQLGAHLAVCPGCAWEQAATGDFARESGDALDAAQVDRLVSGALARAGLVVRAETPRSPVTPPVRVRPAPAFARWIAAAAMIAAAVLAAIALPGRGVRDGAREDPSLASATESNLDAGARGAPSGGDT